MKRANFHHRLFVLLAGPLLAAGCTELNGASSYPGGRYDGGYGGGYSDRDPYYRDRDRYRGDDYRRRREWERNQDEERRIERERDRLEDERRRLEEERRRQQESYRPPPPPPASQDRCPPGFTPSEQKCSREERRRGCQDIRRPSGLGCVKR